MLRMTVKVIRCARHLISSYDLSNFQRNNTLFQIVGLLFSIIIVIASALMLNISNVGNDQKATQEDQCTVWKNELKTIKQASIESEREYMALQQKYLTVLQENLKSISMSKDVLKDITESQGRVLILQESNDVLRKNLAEKQEELFLLKQENEILRQL